MALSDRLGLAVSTSSSEALTAYEQSIDLALRWRSGAMDALNAAVVSDLLSPWRIAQRHMWACAWGKSIQPWKRTSRR